MQTYVYKGKEVFLTGRTADKETRRSVKVLHEVRPIKYRDMSPVDGVDDSEWVTMEQLYSIRDKDEENNE